MNRREFFNRLNPRRHLEAEGNDSAPRDPATCSDNDLFLMAMAQGIDPATVSPASLRALLGSQAGVADNPGR